MVRRDTPHAAIGRLPRRVLIEVKWPTSARCSPVPAAHWPRSPCPRPTPLLSVVSQKFVEISAPRKRSAPGHAVAARRLRGRMQKNGWDFLLGGLCAAALFAASLTCVWAMRPWTVSWFGDYHVVVDTALLLTGYGLLSDCAVHGLLRLKPVPDAPATRDMEGTRFTYWKLLTILYPVPPGPGRAALDGAVLREALPGRPFRRAHRPQCHLRRHHRRSVHGHRRGRCDPGQCGPGLRQLPRQRSAANPSGGGGQAPEAAGPVWNRKAPGVPPKTVADQLPPSFACAPPPTTLRR